MIFTALLLKEIENQVLLKEDVLIKLLISLQKDVIILVFINLSQISAMKKMVIRIELLEMK